MPIKAKPGEQYTIRRKILKIFGAAFHIYDEHGSVVGYCKQKAFKLKEDIRLYTDESMSDPLLTLSARSIIDFGATYDITMPDGTQIGSLRRKGLKSTFLKDEWLIYDDQGTEIGSLKEKNLFMAFMRRGDLSAFFPPTLRVLQAWHRRAGRICTPAFQSVCLPLGTLSPQGRPRP